MAWFCAENIVLLIVVFSGESNGKLLTYNAKRITIQPIKLESDKQRSEKAIRENESRNFPLDGCSTDKMDVLVLFTEVYRKNNDLFDLQQFEAEELSKYLFFSTSEESAPRIRFAQVYDRFYIADPLVNVSAWQFMSTVSQDLYGVIELDNNKRENYDVQRIIKKKVAFTQRLFSEMDGVRENVTKVAVFYLDGGPFSYEEIRSVPHLIEQQDTDIKIFTVVVRGEDDQIVAVHLSDTLVGTLKNMPARALVMAICNQCDAESIEYRHPTSADYLNCYKILEFGEIMRFASSETECINGYYGILVTMETDEEFEFLRDKLVSYFKGRGNHSDGINAVAHIGLERNDKSKVTRFRWTDTYENRLFPLVVNKWLPGKPSGGYTHRCAVWQFTWDRSANMDAVNVSSSNEEFVDGWLDVGCEDEIASFGLCETALPRRIDELSLLKIKPANEESFRRVLKKQDFTMFGENLVSITANIVDSDFRKFLPDNNRIIPLFDCSSDVYILQYISYLHVCDNLEQCDNGGDETICPVIPQKSQSHENVCTKKCYGVQCCDGSCVPLQLVNDGEVDCWICDNGTESFSDELPGLNKYLKRNETCAFICNNDQCVHFSQLNDGHTDCTGPEGPLDETVGKLKTADTCYNMLGHKIWAPMCVYVKDRFDNLLGCRDLSHLKNCTDFECPEGYVKCPNTYCIPQHYVLDGTLDCPTGEDEQDDIIGPCMGHVTCWNSKICLHPDLVCDGHPDCHHGDDEEDCDDRCAEGFRCVAGTVTVSDYNRSVPFRGVGFESDNARYVDLSGLDLSNMTSTFSQFSPTTLFFKCLDCKIDNFGSFFSFFTHMVQELDISFNKIQKVDGDEIVKNSLEHLRVLNMSYNKELALVRSLIFSQLEILDLSHTALASIDESKLAGLSYLQHLNLSFTQIIKFNKKSLPSKVVLQKLDLRGLLLEGFHEDLLNGLTVSHDLYTDSYQLCCPQVRGANIPDHTCHAPDDAISSCFDLIGVDVQRVLLWVVAVLAVLGNMAVIVYRVIWDRSVLRTGYGLFVTNLSISDFIMGVYLFIIAGADYYYHGVYVLHDESWRESVACTLAGFLATLSSETSMFFTFISSLEIISVMIVTFGQFKFTKNCKSLVVILSWIFGFLLALTPIIFRFELYSSNAACLGLPLTTKRINGWEFSFGVFIVLNMSLCLVIAYVQRAIFRAMSENRIDGTESSTSPRRIEDLMVAKELSLVALLRFFCWFPIGVMGLMSLSGREISNDVFAWITVIVVPINSAINPLLYTITALMARWEKFKRGGKTPR